MDKDIKIVLDNGYLDIDNVEGFGITYAVDDVKNIQNKNSSYSKTIILKGTKNNNLMLGNLFSINSTFTIFNPNAKTNGFISVNSTSVMKGYFQLRAIRKLAVSDTEGNRIQYDIVFFDEAIDLINKVGDKLLNSLDLGSWNHRWNYEQIAKTWGLGNIERLAVGVGREIHDVKYDARSWTDCFVYPAFFKGNTKDGNIKNDGDRHYTTEDFYPAIYLKFYLYKIALESGLEIGGDFWDNSPTTFENEIIPYNRSLPLVANSVILENVNFQAGMSSSSTIVSKSYTFAFGDSHDTALGDSPSFPALNIDNVAPFFDDGIITVAYPNGNFNTVNFGFEPTQSAYYDVDGVIAVEIIISNTGTYEFDDTYNVNSPTGKSNTIELTATVVDIATGLVSSEGISKTVSVDFTFPELLTETDTQYATVGGNLLQDFFVKESETVRLSVRVVGASPHYRNHLVTPQSEWVRPVDTLLTVRVIPALPSDAQVQTKMYNSVKTGKLSTGKIATLVENNTLRLSGFIPEKVKQIDLFTDLIKRYNLMILKDNDNPNKLNLITRDRFYELGASKTLDWSDKLDLSSEQRITLLQDLQSKKVNFSYKKGNDDFSKIFNEATSEVYGTKNIEFDNSFISGEKKVQSIFSSIPLIQDEGVNPSKIVTAINTKNPKCDLTILQYGGFIPTINNRHWTFTFVDPRDNIHGFLHLNSYPYAGHYDNPFTPSHDLHFNQMPNEFYTHVENTTNSNLYNNHWRNYMNQISRGRMLYAKFNLNETDIFAVKNDLDTRIFIHDSWYVINKIIDFDPTNADTTIVELLRMSDPTPFIFNRARVLHPTDTVIQDPRREFPETQEQIDFTLGGVLDNPIGGATNGGIIFTPIVVNDPVKTTQITTVPEVLDGGEGVLSEPFPENPISIDLLDGGEDGIKTASADDLPYNTLDGAIGIETWTDAGTIIEESSIKVQSI